jgi:hypothetical protein
MPHGQWHFRSLTLASDLAPGDRWLCERLPRKWPRQAVMAWN